MNQNLMLWPVMGQILLVVVLYAYLAIVKARELKAGNVDRKLTAVDQDKWPLPVRLINNNLRNQFETPILFYVITICLMALGAANQVTLAIACGYVLMRCVHSYVHVTSNKVPIRLPAFVVGFVLLQVLFAYTVKALLDVS
jgi:hypothetical protein